MAPTDVGEVEEGQPHAANAPEEEEEPNIEGDCSSDSGGTDADAKKQEIMKNLTHNTPPKQKSSPTKQNKRIHISPYNKNPYNKNEVSINDDGDIIVKPAPFQYTEWKKSNDEFTTLLMRKCCNCSDKHCKATLRKYYEDPTAPYAEGYKGSEVYKPQLLLLVTNPNKCKVPKKAAAQRQFWNRAVAILGIKDAETKHSISIAIHHFHREVIERYRLMDGKTKFRNCLLPASFVEESDKLGWDYTEEDKFNCVGTNVEQPSCAQSGVCDCNVYINVPFVTVDQAKDEIGKKPRIQKNTRVKLVSLVPTKDQKKGKKEKGDDVKNENKTVMGSVEGGESAKKEKEAGKKKGKAKKVDESIIYTKKTHQMYEVVVPGGVAPGQTFSLVADGQRVTLICPQSAQPGVIVRFQLPIPPEELKQKAPKTFEVVVPEGVKPNESFSLLADGQKVTLMCPPNAQPGQTVRFQLPVANAVNDGKVNECKTCKLCKPREAFGKGQWNRFPDGSGQCNTCIQDECDKIAAMSSRQVRAKITALKEENQNLKEKYDKAARERGEARAQSVKLEKELRAANKKVKSLETLNSHMKRKLSQEALAGLAKVKAFASASGAAAAAGKRKQTAERHDLNADGTVRVRKKAKKNPDG